MSRLVPTVREKVAALSFIFAVGSAALALALWRMSRLMGQGTTAIVPRQQPLQDIYEPFAATELVTAWGAQVSLIHRQLLWDFLLLFGYLLIGLAVVGFVRLYVKQKSSVRHRRDDADHDAAVTANFVVLAVVADALENIAMFGVLQGCPVLQPLVYAAAWTKLGALGLAGLRVVWQIVRVSLPERQATTGEARRSAKAGPREGILSLLDPKDEVLPFASLVQEEANQIDTARGQPPAAVVRSATVELGASGEPWVAKAAKDRFGLALSGGGIRSATFNLGLLQSMASLGILQHVHYLSTVSGGGYIGGFWTRWLARRPAGDTGGDAHFPIAKPGTAGDQPEIRHLREFSRFLLPRPGAFRTEFWAVVMTVLGGLLPSLVAALAVICLAWATWIYGVHILLSPEWCGWAGMGALLAVFLTASEWSWLRRNLLPAQKLKRTHGIVETGGYTFASLVSLYVGFHAWHLWDPGGPTFSWSLGGLGASAGKGYWVAVAPASAALVLLVLRTVLGRVLRDAHRIHGVSILSGMERVLSRLLGLTTAGLVFGVLWMAGAYLNQASFEIQATTAGSAAGLAGLFAWLRKWLFEPVEETRSDRLIDAVTHWLKRATPRVLATLVWLLLIVLVAAGVDGAIARSWFAEMIVCSLAAIGITMVFFDPMRVGLHEFYRSRISRCYLGASNLPKDGSAADNRAVNEAADDDITMEDLFKAHVKPLHLVCTAANDLSGDHLATLYRGAKSAVLSQNGISIGNETARVDYLRYSAALTASAAAFNSQMGKVSMTMGPPVAFLMSALNLRLGLWVPHPRNRRRTSYWLPGRFFFRELFGHSRTDGNHLHLSDGAHFENLALYELIRRHCRWILVSDCGEDDAVAFDDLANVLRRVREDFGVEVDLDTSPLKADATGKVRQHAIVGTIHYNGPTGDDKGTIVYFKPTLTGDEPSDIQNYKARTQQFPHESTGDQFFDEAQWESYRRLGEHAGWSMLGFTETLYAGEFNFTDRLFMGVRERLHPSADGHQDTFVEMSNRCAELEASLCNDGPVHLRRELFPEAADSDPKLPRHVARDDDEVRAISYLMRALQIMEDVWLACDLDRYWSHPLNEGWMNYFQRWASTPTFRRWWPVLRPIYSSGFREFAKERFGVGLADPDARPNDRLHGAARLTLVREDDQARF